MSRRDLGALILRVGIGVMFVFHGAPKLFGGPERWADVGAAMGALGLAFAPAFFGLMAALSELVGGLLLVSGRFVRPACAFMAFTMLVALASHLHDGDPFVAWSHAAEDGIAFVALFFLASPPRA
jgi:putative oxidoreductase